MATYYLRSGAAGAGTGADWANAYTTLAAALTGKAAGDTIYVSEDHAETQASAMTLSPGGTIANPVRVICVDHLGTVPPVSADLRSSATVTTTGTSSITFSGGGGTTYRGIIFNAGTGAGAGQIILPNSASTLLAFDNCSLRLVSTGGGKILLGNGGFVGCYVDLHNTTVSFAGTGQGFSNVGVHLRWRNTASALLGTIPTTLFDWSSNARSGIVEVDGVDLSAAGAGKTLVGNTNTNAARASFNNCKLNASVTKTAVPVTPGSLEVDFYRCDSSGTNYAFHRERYAGVLDHETTIIRTGGANDGTTGLSWKIVTTANANVDAPFESPPIAIWNDTTGSSVTATIEGIWGGGAVPNDDEIWVEVQYLGDASSPQGSFVNDGKADPLATAAGQASSSETWGGSTTKFKLGVSFTPQQKGWIFARVKAAKASSTFYIDPKVTLS